MTIISASRRTDIPAFFPEWFMHRIREGWFLRVNPFNPKQTSRVSLAPADVDAIVFWTKNPLPLLPHLDELDRRGFRYYFQFTLNPYGHPFETRLPALSERIETFRRLSERIGPDRIIWRYDPIVVSDATRAGYHAEHAEALAAALDGSTQRLVFSFLDFYGKVAGRLATLEKERGITFIDVGDGRHEEEALEIASRLKEAGAAHGMEVVSCAEQVDLSPAGIEHGACIDGDLIRRVFGIDRTFRRDRNQRGACRCVVSIDMGMYDTCSYQCDYCYGMVSGKTTERNVKKHRATGPALVDPADPA